jgi:hypothetical protein
MGIQGLNGTKVSSFGGLGNANNSADGLGESGIIEGILVF